MKALEDFFRALDTAFRAPSSQPKVRLRVIGSAALMLQAPYERGTKDSDILETATLGAEVKARLLRLAGRGTPMHTRHRMYLDIVPNGLPFLPNAPACHDLAALNASLNHFELEALDIVDVVVSKLKRFSASDQSDIRAMIDLDLVPREALARRFRAAVDVYTMDARSDELPVYVERLHQVERDWLGETASDIELPDWV